jgi:hypothetical protein
MDQSSESNHHNNRNHCSTEDIMATPVPVEARPAPFWRVWTCIEVLLAEHTNTSKGSSSVGDGEATKNNDNVMMQEPYRTTTIQVAWILQK